MDLPSHHRFPRIRNRKPRPPPRSRGFLFSQTQHTTAILGRGFRPGALHVLLGGPAQPYPKRLPVYFASGGSMTASGILYPRGPFLFQLLEPLEVGGLTSVARPLSGPPSSGRVRVLYR